MSAASQRTMAADLDRAVIGLWLTGEALTARQALGLMASIGAMAKRADADKSTILLLVKLLIRLSRLVDRLSTRAEVRRFGARERGARPSLAHGSIGSPRAIPGAGPVHQPMARNGKTR